MDYIVNFVMDRVRYRRHLVLFRTKGSKITIAYGSNKNESDPDSQKERMSLTYIVLFLFYFPLDSFSSHFY